MIKDRTKDTLYPIIRQHVERETKIITDGAQVYRHLDLEGYEFETVKHKQSLIPKLGHTLTVWKECGEILKENLL